MKIYISYVVSGFLNFWMITFYLGFSTGFASRLPLIALLGAIALFIIAAPIYIYSSHLGTITGLICCITIIPYGLMTAAGIIEDKIFNLGILLIIPFMGILASLYMSVRYLSGGMHLHNVQNNFFKFVLSSSPIILFIFYVLLYGKYWNMSDFIVKQF